MYFSFLYNKFSILYICNVKPKELFLKSHEVFKIRDAHVHPIIEQFVHSI